MPRSTIDVPRLAAFVPARRAVDVDPALRLKQE
jgi:hypothetical protein